MKCENCKNEHDGIYGSGRFCSIKCARGFSTKNKRNEINEKVSQKLKGIKANKNRNYFTDEQRRKGVLKSIEINLIKKELRLQQIPFQKLSYADKREKIKREQNNKCDICKCDPIWNNMLLVFELDHIDGNNQNNERSNLRLICPNCHTQTPTFRKSKNPKKSFMKVIEKDFVEALKNSTSIYQALLLLKLNPRGANYNRAKELIKKHNVTMPL